jgi:lauroyl/myristoyl acyltransferase
MNVQFGQMLEILPHLRVDTEVVTRGQAAAMREMLERLREPGWAPIIAPDAPVQGATDQTYSRPVAAWADRAVATGAAQISRIAQVPIALCIPYVDDAGGVVLWWSEVIPAPPRRDRSADEVTISRLMDDIELAVGRRPDQYVLEIGWGRRWDPTRERWVALDGDAGVA